MKNEGREMKNDATELSFFTFHFSFFTLVVTDRKDKTNARKLFNTIDIFPLII